MPKICINKLELCLNEKFSNFVYFELVTSFGKSKEIQYISSMEQGEISAEGETVFTWSFHEKANYTFFELVLY